MGEYTPPSERVSPLGILVPSFQTKTLMVSPVGGDNCRIFPPNCMVGLSTISDKAEFCLLLMAMLLLSFVCLGTPL